MSDIAELRVELGPASYDILVGPGLIARAGAEIAPLLKRPRLIIVTESHVAGLHEEALRASLNASGIAHETITLPPGEGTKSFSVLNTLCEGLAERRVERGDMILALGGGVIGDLAGFAAAIINRGIDFIQVPTTLLAQVDSSVGGKTGINLKAGKNLVGAFHQPRLVLADVDLLGTLPDRDFLAGYAEVVKYGALGDRRFFDWLEDNLAAIKARDAATLTEMVRHCCQMKADIVAEDEKEKGKRALLNLGHTFGHGLEACAHYDGRLLHGEAVAIGMGMAFDLSARMGLAPQADGDALRDHLTRAGCPVLPRDLGLGFAADDVLSAMTRDKKAVGGQMVFILARALGETFVSRDVDLKLVETVLADFGITRS